MPEINIFQKLQRQQIFWGYGNDRKKCWEHIYIIKGPHFTHKKHPNQLRKLLTDEGNSETVMDVIYDTFDISTPTAAPEMGRSKRKRKATDLIVVNPKRIRY